jgi:biopolymer transport protein ExbB
MVLNMKLSFCRKIGVAIVLLVGVSLSHADAKWWDSNWTIRKRIDLDTTTAGAPIADPIGTVPILLRLHDGNFRFADAKEDGSDIRFIAADDKTQLAYHIEKYDGLLNKAFVWVNVPDLKPGAKTTFWLYYGNPKAPRVEDAKSTYDVDTTLIYHFGEQNAPPHDSTGYGNNADKAATPVAGSLIGPGARLDESNGLTIPNSESLGWSNAGSLTWSAWIKPAVNQREALIFSRGDKNAGFAVGVDNAAPFVEINGQRSLATAKLEANSWHHLAVTATASTTTLFVDGQSAATLNAALPPLTGPLILGANTALGITGFSGEIDELNLAKIVRPLGSIKVAVLSQGADKNSKLMTLAADEEKHSWFSGGYVGVILGSLTFDGWLVICLLVVMSAISWVVMVNKARYLGATTKGNAQFFKDWNQVAADLSFLDEKDARKVITLGGRIDARERQIVRHSSVYHIYKIGAEEIRHRLSMEGANAHLLSARSIQAIRASLDGGLVRETQKLNRLMVLLTIAISGGPFLGLLGTVIGVMITFAAIAAQGDVNVNAIAPGIAAALAATVAGLIVAIPALFGYNYLLSRVKEAISDIVAIPALFGYNYLLSRVKDAISDMQVFIDEFVTKIAEYYGGTRGGNDNRERMSNGVPLELIA